MTSPVRVSFWLVMTPRPHQVDAIKFGLSLLESTKARGLVQMPTGSGKTNVGVILAHEWIKNGGNVTFLEPSEEVIEQVRRAAMMRGLCPVIEKAEKHAGKHAPCVVASYNTMWRRYEKHRKPKSLAILDECHHFNYNAESNLMVAGVFERAIGLSATPWSDGCLDFFEHRQHTYSLSQAIRDQVNCDFDIVPWDEPATGKYQIVYCGSYADVRQMCQRIRPSDYAVYQEADARRNIARFRCGALGTIVVNRMLTEGFDLPQIKRVWVARDTESEIFALQMAGRALRPFRGERATIYVQSDKTLHTLKSALTRAG